MRPEFNCVLDFDEQRVLELLQEIRKGKHMSNSFSVEHGNGKIIGSFSVDESAAAGLNFAAIMKLISDIVSKQPISVIIADVLAIFSE